MAYALQRHISPCEQDDGVHEAEYNLDDISPSGMSASVGISDICGVLNSRGLDVRHPNLGFHDDSARGEGKSGPTSTSSKDFFWAAFFFLVT
jgi:hypothetical protein